MVAVNPPIFFISYVNDSECGDGRVKQSFGNFVDTPCSSRSRWPAQESSYKSNNK